MEVEMEVEGQDEEAEREMAPKKLRIRGEAQVTDERREPTSHEAKALIIPTTKSKFNFEHVDSFCYVLMFSLLCITDWHTNVLIIVQQLDI
jgi:hypothetical protein